MKATGILLCLLVLSEANGQVAKLYPVDQADQDSSFFMFRHRLLTALVERDTTFLYARLAPDIKTSFGSDPGVEDFRRQWTPEAEESALWSTLVDVVAGGGRYTNDGRGALLFEAPYWNSEWDGMTYDAFEFGVIVGERVNVRSSPSVESDIIRRLSYDIVRVLDFYPVVEHASSGEWVKLELADGRPGFVHRDFVRSPVDHRARFVKQDSRWVIAMFLAGD